VDKKVVFWCFLWCPSFAGEVGEDLQVAAGDAGFDRPGSDRVRVKPPLELALFLALLL